MILNININDLYKVINNPIYIEKIFKPDYITDDNIIVNSYDIIKFDDVPNELKVLINTNIIIHTRYNITFINDILTIHHIASLIAESKDFSNILNDYKFKFDIIFKKNNNDTELDFKFYDFMIIKDNNEFNFNPLTDILTLILNNYFDNVLIPNIKKKYLIKLDKLLFI